MIVMHFRVGFEFFSIIGSDSKEHNSYQDTDFYTSNYSLRICSVYQSSSHSLAPEIFQFNL